MRLRVNGVDHEIEHADEPLLWVLRDELGLVGTRYGCGIGVCGCCTVLVDGDPRRSCQLTTSEVGDAEITTLEGIAEVDADGEIVSLHPVQEEFLATPLQCGWCLPGHVMTAVALLDREPAPTPSRIAESAATNLCRCGGYGTITAAIARAATRAAQEPPR